MHRAPGEAELDQQARGAAASGKGHEPVGPQSGPIVAPPGRRPTQSRVAMSPAAVIALQRAAGQRAVSALLNRQAGSGRTASTAAAEPEATEVPLLQRAPGDVDLVPGAAPPAGSDGADGSG